ncbi:hypothetical protein [Amycolatopsis vastitatis]|uniref:hypothetical protein n=1 Tax=Amycolatopsis vastitatis TaxID=1905142 RepID=UPI00130420C3|nr:hypothetical protein [Amycolatopsis vastitatis]
MHHHTDPTRRAHRAGQTFADLAAGLGVSQADVEQMLTDANVLLAQPPPSSTAPAADGSPPAPHQTS